MAPLQVWVGGIDIDHGHPHSPKLVQENRNIGISVHEFHLELKKVNQKILNDVIDGR